MAALRGNRLEREQEVDSHKLILLPPHYNQRQRPELSGAFSVCCFEECFQCCSPVCRHPLNRLLDVILRSMLGVEISMPACL